jgi:hypothetical protein
MEGKCELGVVLRAEDKKGSTGKLHSEESMRHTSRQVEAGK